MVSNCGISFFSRSYLYTQCYVLRRPFENRGTGETNANISANTEPISMFLVPIDSSKDSK